MYVGKTKKVKMVNAPETVKWSLDKEGKTYAGNSSFIFDTAQTYMCYYNEAIWNELALPDPYELVKSGNWTQDKFAEFASMALKDQDGSGEVDSEDDLQTILNIMAEPLDWAPGLPLKGAGFCAEYYQKD